MSRQVAIVAGARTPFCKAGGALKDMKADDLGAIVTREIMARTGIEPDQIDEVIFGNVVQPADAANVARVIALKAGLPQHTIAHTVQRNCASGMQAITTAALHVQAGKADAIIAGGTESMSQIPLLYGPEMTALFASLMRAKTLRQRLGVIGAFRPRFLRPIIALQLGLTDPICGLNMGETAEVLAREFGITRDEQDAYALRSHQRAAQAQDAGRLDQEITPVVAPPTYDTMLNRDDGPRPNQTMEALQKLRPYFDRYSGTVTVGNACPITDGAAAVLVCSQRMARRLKIDPLGHVNGWAYAALSGDRMGLGPTYATARLLDELDEDLADYDRIELNEAFAAQVLANERACKSKRFARRELGRDQALGRIEADRLNVNGGAIALGHPVGATGARLVVTLLETLRQRDEHRGLATLCIGGGQGAAISLEAA